VPSTLSLRCAAKVHPARASVIHIQVAQCDCPAAIESVQWLLYVQWMLAQLVQSQGKPTDLAPPKALSPLTGLRKRMVATEDQNEQVLVDSSLLSIVAALSQSCLSFVVWLCTHLCWFAGAAAVLEGAPGRPREGDCHWFARHSGHEYDDMPLVRFSMVLISLSLRRSWYLRDFVRHCQR